MAATSRFVAGPSSHLVVRGAAVSGARASVGPHTTSGVHVLAGTRWVRTRSGNLVLRPAIPISRNNSHSRFGNHFANRPVVSQDVPGLGFDYAHFAATHPNGSRGGRFRDRGFVGAFVPFFGGGGYYMPLFPDDVEDEAGYDAEQAAAEEAQAETEEVAEQPEPPRQSRARAPQLAVPPAAPVAATPEPPSDQYVFVRRDGSLFFAVGYTWDNGTLRYVTSEGLRRSVEGKALDLDATQQFNQQRGLAFRAPA
jgi:hypothetical protein